MVQGESNGPQADHHPSNFKQHSGTLFPSDDGLFIKLWKYIQYIFLSLYSYLINIVILSLYILILYQCTFKGSKVKDSTLNNSIEHNSLLYWHHSVHL